MENSTNILIQTLPPILTSIGGFFVLLFFSYGKEDKEIRILSAVLFVLLIWSVYICTIIAGEKLTLFSPYITIASLAISILLFLFVFILNINTKEINNKLILSLFVIGIISSTIGFSNYFGMQNRIVISIHSKCENMSITKDIKKEKDKNSKEEKDLKIQTITYLNETGYVVTSQDLSKIKRISIDCNGDPTINKSINAFHQSSRGLGVEYVLY